MDRDRFNELQFQALRKEIDETKDRIFRLMVGGASIIPVVQLLAVNLNLLVIQLFLPFIVIILVLLFLSENNDVMRCGRYIRMNIEPTVPDNVGWEKWLEMPGDFDARAVDKYVVLGFYILSFFYYLVASYLASQAAQTMAGIPGLALALSVFASLGIWTAILLVRNAKITTSTKLER